MYLNLIFSMKKLVLSNSLTVIFEKTNSKSITLGVCVKTGSINENDKNRGISHFLEHLIFEGTKNRTGRQIVKEIEGVGGEFNAFTNQEITFFYAKLLSKFFDNALNVISDILQNSLFKEKIIEKERKVVLEEMNLWKDDPKSYQWYLFQKALYKNHPAKFPVIGFKETLLQIKRDDVIDYFNKYYVPKNMIVVLTGNIDSKMIEKLTKEFNKLKDKKFEKIDIKNETENFTVKLKEKKDVLQSYLIIGFKTGTIDEEDSYVLDLISIILGWGQSSRLFNEIRMKRGLSYDVGAVHESNKTFGYFGAYVSCDKKNIDLCRNLILKEFKLKNLNNEEIEDAKNMLEGLKLIRNEDTKELATSLGYWEYCNKAENFYRYIKKIRKITKEDILRVQKKYFTGKYTEILIHK